MEEKPYDLVNIRIWRKTRRALKRLTEISGGSMVMNLNASVQAALYQTEKELSDTQDQHTTAEEERSQ